MMKLTELDRWPCWAIAVVFIFAVLPRGSVAAELPVNEVQQARPNIIWIVVEDQSRHYGCYGEKLVDTPTINRLAQQGAKFTNAAVTSPVCSTARSALITGMYQTSIGAHHHRSGRGRLKIKLPDHIKLIPEYLREAGYYTCLGSLQHVVKNGSKNNAKRRGRLGKSDYNFVWNTKTFQSNDWSQRKSGQPFFAKITLAGGKARELARKSPSIPHVDTRNVRLPPYYPDHPVIRADWAAYLDTFTLMDRQVAAIVGRLKREGLLDKTAIFFFTDHGISHARGKQFCYDEGIMVPLIVRYPKLVPKKTVRRDLTVHIDVAATTLNFAGINVPKHMQGRPLFGTKAKPREYLVAARDRCDETTDRIRCVRTHRFKYIRNGFPQRPHLQPNAYKDNKPIYQIIRALGQAGQLTPLQHRLLLSPTRPREELYDLSRDRWEINNLATSPEHAETLVKMRRQLDDWIKQSGDQGQALESEAMYASDMKVYLDTIQRRRPERLGQIKANIRRMKKWRSEGK